MTAGVAESGDGAAAAEAERGDGPATADGGSGGGPAAMERTCGVSPDAPDGESGDRPAVTVGRRAPAGPGRDAGSAPEWTTSRLDQGTGWTLDVVRPRRVGGVAGGDVVARDVGADENVVGNAASGAMPEPVA